MAHILRVPVASLRLAARVEAMLRRAGFGRLSGVSSLRERVVRRWLLRHPEIDSPLVEVESEGIRLAVPGPVVRVFLDRPFDPVTVPAFRRALRPGMRVVDVGAHIGFYTLLAAHCVGSGGRVWAIEPAPDNLAVLRANIERSGAAHVSLLPVAAGARPAARELHLASSSDMHSLYPHALQTTAETVPVEQRPLDALVEGAVDLVKIDVEGAEYEVLDGMRRILAENRRLAILAEWNPLCLRAAGADGAGLPARLAAEGFALEVLDDHSQLQRSLDELLQMARTGALPNSWYCNLMATRDR